MCKGGKVSFSIFFEGDEEEVGVGLNYVRCTIVQWQWIPQRETQAELESETGIQQIRAGMLKYCKNTEIQRAAVETKLRQQEQQLSRACSLSLPVSLSSFIYLQLHK